VYDQDVQLGESAQFVVPMLSRRPVADPTTVTEFTLNQFNMVVTLDDIGLDVSQIHFYPHNPAMEEALPKLLQSPGGQALGNHVLRRLTVGLGYLPSWESPAIRMRVTAPDTTGGLAGIRLSGDERTTAGNPMFRKVVRRMLRAAPRLDLWPVLPMAFISAPGKSYHFGGSLPHRTDPADGPLTTDRQGRLAAWSKVHMVDASVFPTVPATTFTLTIMANAHRIARESMEADA
jgi:choline dehydrogenase-like flavoprotein